MRFVIVDGLPYFYADNKTYSCKWDEKGLTIGAEVKLASVPDHRLTEREVFAKCRVLNSIKEEKPKSKSKTAKE